MRLLVVEDAMHVPLRRDHRLTRVKERAEFTATLPLMQFPDHLIPLHVQDGKQRGAPVARMVVRALFDLPRHIGNNGCVRSNP